MKKLVSLLLALLLLAGMMAVPAMASEDVKVYLFGEKLEFDVPAQIVNGRTMVPVRKIFESLGYTVDWNNDTRTATATSTERTISITIDATTMYVNNEAKTLDVPACIIDGRTLVPARAVSEASGYKVDWDGDTRSVLITKEESSEVTKDECYDILKNYIVTSGNYNSEKENYSIDTGDVYACYYVDKDKITLLKTVEEEGKTTVYLTLEKGTQPNVSIYCTYGGDKGGAIHGIYDGKGVFRLTAVDILNGVSSSELVETANSVMMTEFDSFLTDSVGISILDFVIEK